MQGGSHGIVYGGLKYQARCLAGVRADAGHTSFLAATLSLKEENEVHLIRLSPGGNEVVCDGLFYHPGEVWDIKSCPFDQKILSTVFSAGETFGASIWKIPEVHSPSNNSPQLEQLVSLNEHSFKVKCILWWPQGKHDKLVSIDEGNLFVWSLDASNKAAKVISQEPIGMLQNFSGGAWDPHDHNAVATVCDSSLQCWDLRSMKKLNAIEHAHIRDMDYNPKKQHMIATAENEFGIRLWDLRRPKSPVKELPGHTHWTWAVLFNPEHEDLLLSSGTDSTVNLWSVPAVMDASVPESIDDTPRRPVDPLLHSYTDYEDSIYGIAWSFSEPSLFASLSYDGRIVLESVKPYLQKR